MSKKSNFIVELSSDGVSCCRKNGSEISTRSKLFADLRDCCKSGDCQAACEYVISEHLPEFRIVKRVNGEYENVIADHSDKAKVCKAIYFESESDFTGDEKLCEVYLIWQAAFDLIESGR